MGFLFIVCQIHKLHLLPTPHGPCPAPAQVEEPEGLLDNQRPRDRLLGGCGVPPHPGKHQRVRRRGLHSQLGCCGDVHLIEVRQVFTTLHLSWSSLPSTHPPGLHRTLTLRFVIIACSRPTRSQSPSWPSASSARDKLLNGTATTPTSCVTRWDTAVTLPRSAGKI